MVHPAKKEHEDIAWAPTSTIRYSIQTYFYYQVSKLQTFFYYQTGTKSKHQVPAWVSFTITMFDLIWWKITIVTVLQATGQVEESIGQKILRKVGKAHHFLFSIKCFIYWLLTNCNIALSPSEWIKERGNERYFCSQQNSKFSKIPPLLNLLFDVVD